MKISPKIICTLALMFLFVMTQSTVAESGGMFSVEGENLCLCVPNGAQFLFLKFTGEQGELEPVGDAEEDAAGTTTVRYTLPEGQKVNTEPFLTVVKTGEIGYVAMFAGNEKGDIVCLGFSRSEGDIYIDCSEGYDCYIGRTLYVRLPGSEYTGYEWNMIPDSSGVYELADVQEIDMSLDPQASPDDPEHPVTKTATGFFLIPGKNAPGREGSVRFELVKTPNGEGAGRTVAIRCVLDENGEFFDFEMLP